jgi:SAM-dependent methyltransferase
MATREDILLEPVARTASIVEIGASYNPIAPKRQGWNTKTVDIGTKSELIEKYRSNGVDLDNIEEVDFVWRDGPLIDAVPHEYHGIFDAFVASHVIEHQPDIVAFLDCAARLLKESGIVVLVIPDKRFCFDYFRPFALTGDVLASHRAGRIRHSSQTTFNFNAYTVSANGGIAWSQQSLEHATFAFFVPLEHAYSQFLACDENHTSPYIDMHAWQFTPASFQLLILELARLGITDWRVDQIGPAVGCEFYAWLRRGGREAATILTDTQFNTQRLSLLRRTLSEAKEQIEFLMPARTFTSAELILATETVKTENEALRLECSALKGERDALAAASAKWFEAAVAVTADFNPLIRVPPGQISWLRRVRRRFVGNSGRRSPMVLANHARDTRKWELAVRYYRDALNLKPDEAGIWVQYGHALKEAGKISEAEIAYRKSLELDAKNADANAALGHALDQQDKSAEVAAA